MQCNTPGMISHPPINIEVLSKHVKSLKADNGLMFIQEFEVNNSMWWLKVTNSKFMFLFK